jgi:hypothetical protein
MKTRTVEEKHYFDNRTEAQSNVDIWMHDPSINRVWFSDRFWQKNDPKRFEVIIQWKES